MKRRYFLMAAVAGAALLTGCKQGPNETYLGYWKRIDDRNPFSGMPLHIKPNGNDYMARLGQDNIPANESSPGIFTILTGHPFQFKYDKKTDQLQNIDDNQFIFQRVSEDEYRSIYDGIYNKKKIFE